MQALVLRGARRLGVEDLPEPRPGAGEVLVQVAACGICGSDLHGYLGHSARRLANVPLVMGHEFAGRVVEFGPGADEAAGGALSVGDAVIVQPQIYCGRCRACRSGLSNVCPHMALIGIERAGGFAQLVTVPAHRLFPLPAGLSEVEGAMVETLAVEVHLFRQMAPALARTVVVLGAGAQGLLAVQLARLAGATQVIACDLVPQRLALAERLGATVIVQADREDVVKVVRDRTEGWGAEFVVDAVGAAVTRQQGVAMLAPGGTLGLVGLGHGETTLDFIPVVGKELSIRGSYCYTDDDFARSLELIATGQVRVGDMIDTASLGEGAAYFRRLVEEPAALTKVLLQPE